jgi:hypothetical protein
VTAGEAQASGDYGYDLAHEEIGRVPAPGATTGHEHGGAPPAGGRDHRSEDLGYDEAHDFASDSSAAGAPP